MSDLPAFYNLSLEDLLLRISERLNDQKTTYGGFRIRSITGLDREKNRHNVLTIIQASPKHSPLGKKQSVRYQNLHFLEEWFHAEELLHLIRGVDSSDLKVDGDRIPFTQDSPSRSMSFLSGHNDLSRFPGHLAKLPKGRAEFSLSTHLLEFELPYYPSGVDAIKEWMEMGHFTTNHQYEGYVLLFLPEIRAYFQELKYEQGSIYIDVDKKDDSIEDLKVKGAVEIGGESANIDVLVHEGKCETKVPFFPEKAKLYLIGKDNTVFDYYIETPYKRNHGVGLLKNASTKPEAQAKVESAVQSGEGETIEFKPYIKLGDQKLNEVVKTVIAFTNTRGGTIFMGISDSCELKGVAQDLLKNDKDGGSIKEKQKKYIGGLKQKIADRLNFSTLSIGVVVVRGKRVIMIDVEQGGSDVCCEVFTNKAYVRRGSNSVIIDPNQDIERIRKRNQNNWLSPFE